MKKLSVMLCLIALLAFTLNGCGDSGTTDTGYYGGGDSGGTTTTAPTVTSCTTNLTPGQTCTIGGTNFGGSRDSGQSTVSFVPQVTGGTTLTATTYLSWSDTAIQCVTPSVVTGIQYVVVVNRYTSSGMLYSSTTYTAGVNGTTGTAPTAAPAVTSQAPNPATAGASVTLTGTNFPISYGYILVNGAVVSSTFTTTTAVFTIPAGTTTGATVTLGGGVGGSTTYSLVIGGGSTTPTITSYSPKPLPLTGNIVLLGQNFGTTAGTVTLNNQAVVVAAGNWTNTQVTGTIPAGLIGATQYNAVITTSGGLTATIQVTTLSPTDPVVTSITPTSGVAAASSATITITGNNFGTTAGTIACNVTGVTVTPQAGQWTNTQILATMTVPTGTAAQTSTLTLTIPGSTVTPSNTIPITAAVATGWKGATLLSTSSGINGAVVREQLKLASFANGNVLGAYECSDGTRNHLYTRIQVAGSAWGDPKFVDNGVTALNNTSPGGFGIATATNGNACIVWQQNNGVTEEIYYSVYSATTQLWSAPAQVTAAAADRPAAGVGQPRVSYDSNNNFNVVWNSATVASSFCYRKFNTAAAVPAFEATINNISNTVAVVTSPDVKFLKGAANGTEGFLVFVEADATAENHIYVRKINSNTVPTTVSAANVQIDGTLNAAGRHASNPVLHLTDTAGTLVYEKSTAVATNSIIAARYSYGPPETWSNVGPAAVTAITGAVGIAAATGTIHPQLAILSNGTSLITYTTFTSIMATAGTWTGTWTWGALTPIHGGFSAVTCYVGLASSGTNAIACFVQDDNTVGATRRLYVAPYVSGSWIAPTSGSTSAIDANLGAGRNVDNVHIPRVTEDSSGRIATLFIQNNGAADLVYSNLYY